MLFSAVATRPWTQPAQPGVWVLQEFISSTGVPRKKCLRGREEVVHAEEEGIEFVFLAAPLEFVGDEQGWLESVRLQRMELGEPDASGRRRPVPIEGSEYQMEIQMAVIAIGNGANPLLRDSPNLKFTKRYTLEVDPETLETTSPGIFAGGDIVTGGATVISAMGAGRKAAHSIDQYLRQS